MLNLQVIEPLGSFFLRPKLDVLLNERPIFFVNTQVC